MPVPDLLCPEPAVRLDAAAMKQTLTFAFASGVPSSAFSQALLAAPLPASTWEPGSFVKALFVAELVAGCFEVTVDGRPYALDEAHLTRILTHPPTDLAVVEFRRATLAELAADTAARRDLEQIYAKLYQLRSLLEAPPLARRLDGNRRRLEILGAAKSGIDVMAGAFAGAQAGVARLRAFGAATQEMPGYARLRALLDYEENLATLDVRLRVGLDGRVRGLEMLSIEENEGNWFYASPVGRFFQRVGALLRGYRFSEQEVLARLLDGVFDGIENELIQLIQLIGDIEFYLAALSFRDLAEKAGLAVCLPEIATRRRDAESAAAAETMAGVGPREIRDLFNPLLLAQGVPIVPCDVTTPRHDVTLIVTGPNSGGKTRLLQALAMTQMLGQCGFFVPARSARLASAPGLFVSLIEESAADQAEGRLGMELLRIRSLFERLRLGSMVVLDELCSGTNPSEGEEIFELVVTLLAELEPQAFITTHFLQMAARFAQKPPALGLVFVQVELDARQIPTYKFVPGVAETSLAHRTAARLGVTREELLALVEASKRAPRG